MLTQVQIIVVLVAVISFVAGVIFRSRFKNSGDVNDALLEDVDTLEDAVKEWREKFYELQERIVHDFPTYFSVNAKGPLIKEIEQRQVYDKYSKGEWVDRQLKSLKVSEGVIKDNLKTIKAIEKTNGSKRGLVVGRQFVVDSINRGHGSDAQD